ncbi:MAG: PIN domain-containing protein [Treponema sp.]|nr:PIN domain-containing protein [Treponema sp.]
MKMYLLDTNIISEPTKASPNLVVTEKIQENIEYSCISSVVWAETLSGIKTLSDGKRKEMLFDYATNQIQKLYEILPFDDFAASIYSDLISQLQAKGKIPQKLDLMIASTAISNNLILVTRNISDYQYIKEVSNLMLENWFD